jgi:hypothetical protein
MTTVDNSASANPTPAVAKTLCANCGIELHGAHCHDCGQPVKGMIRPLSSMLSDVADTIFNIDSRIFRTLFPLYFRPGYLTNEYFAGRRVRYVTPFRLYFFLSVAAFLLMQWSLVGFVDLSNHGDIINLDNSHSSITSAQTPQEVIARRDKLLAGLAVAKSEPFVPTAEIDKAAEKIRHDADKRLTELKGSASAGAKDQKDRQAKPDSGSDKDDLDFDGIPWDSKTHPIRVDWLPQFANDRLNDVAAHMKENLPRIRKDPKPFLIGAFGTLPQVLFVLMPLFALLLKIFYIFKRRLYMEHLIVALHSHAFIFLSLLLLTLAGLARNWAHTAATWLDAPLGLLIFVMGWWLPIYLFLMQKKVYRQGWFFTSLKYCAIGIGYTVMISIGVAAAFVVSLATT